MAATVYFDVWLVVAHAVFMNVLRYDFFTYSSLPENKDSGIHSGNLRAMLRMEKTLDCCIQCFHPKILYYMAL